MHLKSLVRCHQQAFDYCGGWPRSILYDNMKQVRLDAKSWNPHFMDFADHYGIVAKTHRPYRPRTKGKVERMVRYVKDNLLNGRSFADLEDLNAQALIWLEQTANRRVHQTTGQRPRDLLQREQLTAGHTMAHLPMGGAGATGGQLRGPGAVSEKPLLGARHGRRAVRGGGIWAR